MPVSRYYLQYVLDLLKALGPVTAKRMFGGAGLYFEGLFFALIADDVLFFKVDEGNKADYLNAGTEPFKPFGSYVMSYYEVPADVLEDKKQLKKWEQKAVTAAMGKSAARRMMPTRAQGDPVTIPIDGMLDLHAFQPKDVKDLVSDYLAECRGKGILQVRIIHGKGTGSLRETVHALLARMPEVVSFKLADELAGGWGATIVHLKPI